VNGLIVMGRIWLLIHLSLLRKINHEETKGAKIFSGPSISDRVGYALRIFCAAGSHLDAAARRWFRKLHARRVLTLRKPTAMPYRSGVAPLRAKTSNSKPEGNQCWQRYVFCS
jgi:hypothetical protein